MSFWMRLGLAITDIEIFKNMCERYDVEYEECQDPNFWMQGDKVHAILTDRQNRGVQGRNKAYLVQSGGAFKLVMDNDVNYSSIARRVGRNGGKMTRDYAAGVIKKQVRMAGGMVLSQNEQPDGSIVMKASTM